MHALAIMSALVNVHVQGRSKQIYSGQAIMFSFIIVIVMT